MFYSTGVCGGERGQRVKVKGHFKMSELEQLRQEAEQLRNQIRVSPNTDTAKNKPHWGPDHHVRVYVA